MLLELENAGTELDKALAAAPGSSGSSSSSTADPLTSALQSATLFMKEGKRLVMQRQKLVRLADRSDHGWLMVNECKMDELADDEDNERRISKTMKNAEKRVEAAQKRREGAAAGRRQVELVLDVSSHIIGRPVLAALELPRSLENLL